MLRLALENYNRLRLHFFHGEQGRDAGLLRGSELPLGRLYDDARGGQAVAEDLGDHRHR